MFGWLKMWLGWDSQEIRELEEKLSRYEAEAEHWWDEVCAADWTNEKLRREAKEARIRHVAEIKRLTAKYDEMASASLSASVEMQNAEREIERLQKQVKAEQFRADSAQDAIAILTERYGISAHELRQLQVADMKKKDGANNGEVEALFDHDLTDPLAALNAGNDFKQTAGKFRQLRKAFVSYQIGVTSIFDRLEKLPDVSKGDIQEARDAVSSTLRRKV